MGSFWNTSRLETITEFYKTWRQLMKLDSRIKQGKRPLTPFDIDEAREYVGKDCYFSNDITSFAYLGSLNKGELTSVGDDEINPYKHIGERSSYATNFILPCEWVETSRPFTIQEFLQCFNVFETIHYRKKHNDSVLTGQFKGFYVLNEDVTVQIGNSVIPLKTLYNECEVYIFGKWQVFGFTQNMVFS